MNKIKTSQWNEVLAKGITNVIHPPVISQDLNTNLMLICYLRDRNKNLREFLSYVYVKVGKSKSLIDGNQLVINSL